MAYTLNHSPDAINKSGFDFEDADRGLNRPLLEKDDDSDLMTITSRLNAKSSNLFVSQTTSVVPSEKFGEDTFIRNEKLKKQSCWSTTMLFGRHSYRDLKRHKCHYCLAFCSIFVVVLSSLIVASLVDKGPIIFLKMAQGQHGEVDVYFTPTQLSSLRPYSQNKFLNFTTIDSVTDYEYKISPRKVFYGQSFGLFRRNRIRKPKAFQMYQEDLDDVIDDELQQQSVSFMQIQEYQGFPSAEEIYSAPSPYQYSYTLLIDTQKEKEAKIGTNYTFEPLQYGQCNINKDFSRTILAEVGDMVYFQFNADDLLNNLIKAFNVYATEKGLPPQSYTRGYSLRLPCLVTNTLESTYGKFADYDTNHQVVMEYDHYLLLISDYLPLPLSLNQDFSNFIRNPKNVNLQSYSDQVVMSLPSPRYEWYLSNDFDEIQKKITDYSNKFIDRIGFYPVSTQFFIMSEMETFSLGILFVHLVFDIVLLIFIIISILLIYSLLMIGVETKTMETGIMRMVGLSKKSFVGMILLQSIMFALPAITAGFVLCFPCLALAYVYIFKEDLDEGFTPVPSLYAVFQGVFVGLFIPLVSSLFPIFRVLGQNLNDSLNYDRSRVKSIYIEILKKSRANMIPILIFGLMAVAYGIAIYYMLPLSLLSFNFGMILRIFFFILLGMLLGLCLLAVNGQRLLELALTYGLLFFEKKSMKMLVLNNLLAHKMRNRLTAIIYSLALGFIIFLVVSYKLQIDQVRMNNYKKDGSYPQLNSVNYQYMDPRDIDPALMKHESKIQSFSWVTWDMVRYDNMRQIQASDKGKLNTFNIGFYGVSPHIFETTGKKFVDSYYQDEKTGLSLGEQLYTARGSQGVGISAIVTKKTNSDPTNSKDSKALLMNLQKLSSDPKYSYKMRPIFALSQAPLFTVADRSVSYNSKQSALVSLPMYSRYLNKTMDEMFYERLILKMKEGTTEDDQNDLINDIKTGLQWKSYSIQFKTNNDETLQIVDSILGIIFNTIIAITMFLCFFSLSSSMTANLYEQAKEIGILRSMGFTNNRIIMLYMYEALILVMASSLLGVLIGILVGWTMTAQQEMFQNLPTSFYFPGIQILLIFVIAIVCAILSTFGPTKQIINKNIASILRMV